MCNIKKKRYLKTNIMIMATLVSLKFRYNIKKKWTFKTNFSDHDNTGFIKS